jgi:hypothetical protein
MLGLFFDPEDVGDMFLRNVRLVVNRLHGVISQKRVLFITTAVTASNPTDVSSLTSQCFGDVFCLHHQGQIFTYPGL